MITDEIASTVVTGFFCDSTDFPFGSLPQISPKIVQIRTIIKKYEERIKCHLL